MQRSMEGVFDIPHIVSTTAVGTDRDLFDDSFINGGSTDTMCFHIFDTATVTIHQADKERERKEESGRVGVARRPDAPLECGEGPLLFSLWDGAEEIEGGHDIVCTLAQRWHGLGMQGARKMADMVGFPLESIVPLVFIRSQLAESHNMGPKRLSLFVSRRITVVQFQIYRYESHMGASPFFRKSSYRDVLHIAAKPRRFPIWMTQVDIVKARHDEAAARKREGDSE